MGNQEISDKLVTGFQIVRTHVKKYFEQAAPANHTPAVLYVLHEGIIELDDQQLFTNLAGNIKQCLSQF